MGEKWTLALLSVGSAALLHTLVEKRFRYRRPGTDGVFAGYFALGAAGAVALLCAFAFHVHTHEGMPARYPEAYQDLLVEGDRVTRSDAETWRLGRCFLGGQHGREHRFEQFDKEGCLAFDAARQNVLLLGDSTAAHLFHGLSEVHGARVNVLQATIASCQG